MHEDYKTRLAAWEKAKFAPPPEKPSTPAEPSYIQMMSMRDHVRLYTEIFLCPSASSAPVVLIRSPYPFNRPSRNDRRPISRYQQEGYTVVFQLTRGQGESEGQFRQYRNEINDGYDAIQWVTKQAWCNGNIGMEGASYLGSVQLLAAKVKPPALKCIMPTAFIGNFTQCIPFSYGVPNKGPHMQWQQVLDAERWDDMDVGYCDMSALNHPEWGPALRKRPLVEAADGVLSGDKLANWKETITNPLDNEYWQAIHFTDHELADLDIPIFFTDGWYDMTIGPIDFFTRMEKLKPDKQHRYLLVGPWDHYQTGLRSEPGENNGDRILPKNGAIDHMDHRLAFFDRYLKVRQEVRSSNRSRPRLYYRGFQY